MFWRRPAPRHRVLLWHRVVPDDTPAWWLRALGGEAVTQRMFARQLDWLARHFRLVGLEEYLTRQRDEAPMAAVTFDDGLADNLTHALPVLQASATPATVFVIAGLLGTPGFEHHRLARWALENPQAPELAADKRRSPRDQVRALLQLPDAHRASLLASDAGQDRFLGDDEVRTLYRAGVAIGSHTWTHHPLADLTEAQQRDELVRSKLGLERLLDAQVPHLAYPLGRAEHFDANSVHLAREAGYLAAFSALHDTGSDPVDAFAMPRTGVKNDLRRLQRKLA